MHMSVKSEGIQQDFAVGSIPVSVCGPSSTNQSHLSEHWLHGGKQSKWKTLAEMQSAIVCID